MIDVYGNCKELCSQLKSLKKLKPDEENSFQIPSEIENPDYIPHLFVYKKYLENSQNIEIELKTEESKLLLITASRLKIDREQ